METPSNGPIGLGCFRQLFTIRKCLLAKRWLTYSKMRREEKVLEDRFCKPSTVVRSYLDNLAKLIAVEENNDQSLRAL